MLINKENKRIEAVYPADVHGVKKRLSVIDAGLPAFDNDGGMFHLQTAFCAAALAMSASQEEMLRENLNELQYERIVFLSYNDDDPEKIGMALGIREERDGAVIAVVMRPTVGREWYSNFDVGYGMEHLGFLKAAEYAEERIGDYLTVRRSRTAPRFFVSGYSRGGAVANLLAKRLCDRWGLDAVRAYTFAAPNTAITVKGARYSSIFNLVREEDFFCRVPLTGWGYTKYGHTISLSDHGDIARRCRMLSGEDYIGFSSGKPVDDVLCGIMRLAPNVHAYYERRRPVGSREMSLRDYMMTIAAMLADETDETVGDVMMSAMISDYADLSDFLMSGMDIGAFLTPAQGIPRCSVADSHSPAAYMAALDACLK